MAPYSYYYCTNGNMVVSTIPKYAVFVLFTTAGATGKIEECEVGEGVPDVTKKANK